MDKKAALKVALRDYGQRLYYCSNTAEGRKVRKQIETKIKQIEEEIKQIEEEIKQIKE